MILTDIMMTWMTLVFSMLLKEKAPPMMKKTMSQNSKVLSTSISPINLESTLPVMMHFDMSTPKR